LTDFEDYVPAQPHGGAKTWGRVTREKSMV
jgi:hypothetical protein